MTTRSFLRFHRAALAIGIALLSTACGMGGNDAATHAPPALPSFSSGAAPTTPATNYPPVASASPAVARTITEANNGAMVQSAVGENISLVLHAAPGSDPWQVHQPDPAILAPVPSPVTAAPGVTLQSYHAAGPGQAAITAESRPHCDAGGACPGVIQGFRVTVVVTP